MTIVEMLELAAWAVFLAGVLTMLVRGLFLRSPGQKYRTGFILAVAIAIAGPVFAVVYTLAGLGVVDTFWGDDGRRGPWFMAICGAFLALSAPGALRRTRKGMAEHA